MRKNMTWHALVSACAAALTLAGCGGSGSSSSTTDTGGNRTQTSALAVTVIDGAIKNAKVCLDKNVNGACDSGEPSGTTDTAGKTNLTVDSADVGKYPIVAIVGTDAVDSDTGAVTVAYTMKAPADQTAVVSPFTNLVQSAVESTGATTAQAADSVKEQTGLNMSPFSDYTKDTSSDGKTAQILANAIVVTTQQQLTTIAAAQGKTTTSGSTITHADLNKIVQEKISALMPQLVSAATDSAVQSATVTDRITQLSSKARTILAAEGIESAEGAVASVSASKAADDGETTASGTASVTKFTFTDANNYELHILSTKLADKTPDTNNLTGYREYRYQRSGGGTTAAWGAGSAPQRGSDLHWNGSAWLHCPINWKNTRTVRDSSGFDKYNYCNGRETGSSKRTTVDIAGQRMFDVYKSIRSQGYKNNTFGDGTDSSASGLLGGTKFPSGSKLHYQTGTQLSAAVTYYPGSSNYVALQNGTACGSSATLPTNATLEQLIAVNKGIPCVQSSNSITNSNGTFSSGTTNESWASTTLSIGTVGTASTGTSSQARSYYTTNVRLRVAFGDGNVAKYYQCQERYDGSTRNCTLSGTGSYSIQTLGDGRTLTFSGVPNWFANLDYKRVFVERGGKVFYGYQNRPETFKSARFNLTAANAIATQFGLTAHDPEVPLTLTSTSYVGTYLVTVTKNNGTPVSTNTFVGSLDSSAPTCTGLDASNLTTNCTVRLSPRTDSTKADVYFFDGSASHVLQLDFYTGEIVGNWTTTGSSDAYVASGLRR